MDWKEKLMIFLSGIAATPLIWTVVSWVDVLAHQFNGHPHAWNCFVVMVDCYYKMH